MCTRSSAGARHVTLSIAPLVAVAVRVSVAPGTDARRNGPTDAERSEAQ